MDLAAPLIIALLLLSSLGLWVAVAARRRMGLEPLSRATRDAEPVGTFPFVLGAAWISLSLFLQVWHLLPSNSATAPIEAGVESDSTGQPPTPGDGLEAFDAGKTLSRLQADTTIGALVFLLILSALTRAGRIPAERYGIAGSRWQRQVRDGTLGFLAAWSPVFLVLGLTLPLRTPDRLHPVLRLLMEAPSPTAYAWAVVAAAVVAPVFEELLFRVVLQGWLSERLSPGAAIMIAALVFAGVHGFPDSLALIPLALILGYLYHQRHSYLTVVTTHALFNGTMLLLSFLGGGKW